MKYGTLIRLKAIRGPQVVRGICEYCGNEDHIGYKNLCWPCAVTLVEKMEKFDKNIKEILE